MINLFSIVHELKNFRFYTKIKKGRWNQVFFFENRLERGINKFKWDFELGLQSYMKLPEVGFPLKCEVQVHMAPLKALIIPLTKMAFFLKMKA